MGGDKRWPVTVTFSFYFDHEPDGLELARVASWAENSYDRSGDQIPTVADVAYGPPTPNGPVDAEQIQ